ncbi:MAG TPA: pyridoxal-phosphate dependent enzyme, partial [Thermoanaerobaculia bacterium]
HRGSLPTVAAKVLFDMLAADIRESGFPFALKKIDVAALQTSVFANEEIKKTAYAPSSFRKVPEDVGANLKNFEPYDGFAGGEWWQLKFGGPTAKYRNGIEPGLLYLSLSLKKIPAPHLEAKTLLPSLPIVTTGAIAFPDLESHCFCCPTSVPVFDPNDRRCPNPECYSNREADLDGRFVSLLPEPSPTRPKPSEHDVRCLFATLAPSVEEISAPRGPSPDYARLLPYRRDYLAEDYGFHLAAPLVHRSPRLQVWTSLPEVFVLDMATYPFTNTLKDAKSWAVVNLAIERGISNIVTYTAGNAGLSLAKLIYELNLRTSGNRVVYSLVDDSIASNIRMALRSWGSETQKLSRHEGARVVVPKEVWRTLNARLNKSLSSDEPTPGTWHVSDGWDGVGTLMYRILIGELLHRISFDFIVAPLGTGNLVLGAYLGIQDAESPARLIAAVPAGDNLLTTSESTTNGRRKTSDDAIAPKLAGAYTPLARCIRFLQERNEITVLQVSRQMQREAFEYLRYSIASEPSALVAFGALLGIAPHPGLAQMIAHGEEDQRGTRTLVINSGSGVFDEDEVDLLMTNRRKSRR